MVSFTPCVYPVMPITASFIGGINTNGTKLFGFILSLFYVLGLAVTYCALGAFAALTGKFFGQVQNSPAMFLVAAGVLIFLALVMLDMVKMPAIGVNIQHKINPKNIWSVILAGMAAGIIVGPCTAPVLAVILGYVGSKQNLLHGISLLFFFSYGVGASLILVGTFSGLLSSLPKSGMWMVRIKQFCGLVLLIFAVYFLIKAGGLM